MAEGLARQAIADQRGREGLSVGQDFEGEAVVAPASGEWADLSRAPLVANTLELLGADGTVYVPDSDFYEDASRGRFQNLRIPEGETLTAEYHYEEVFADQGPHEIRRHGAPMPQREAIDLRGFAVSDDAAGEATVVQAPSSRFATMLKTGTI